MPNHPSRNWRRVAHDAATRQIDALQALGRIPADGAAVLMTREQLLDVIRVNFVAGYDAGRTSRARPPEPTT